MNAVCNDVCPERMGWRSKGLDAIYTRSDRPLGLDRFLVLIFILFLLELILKRSNFCQFFFPQFVSSQVMPRKKFTDLRARVTSHLASNSQDAICCILILQAVTWRKYSEFYLFFMSGHLYCLAMIKIKIKWK